MCFERSWDSGRIEIKLGDPGRTWLCHILEVLLLLLNVLRSRWARWTKTFEGKIMIIYHWQSGLCGDNLPFPGILPDKYFNTADAKKKPTTICPKNVQIPCFSSALQFWMYLSQNKWVNLGQNLHKCFMKTRRHNVSYIKTTFRELRKPAVRKKNAWPMAIDMVSLARLNILTFYFRQTILKTSKWRPPP